MTGIVRAFGALCLTAGAYGAAHPRHLVMVVIDDLGFDDMGYANAGQITTPNFNYMHSHGIELSQYYVQPSCSPTRATIRDANSGGPGGPPGPLGLAVP